MSAVASATKRIFIPSIIAPKAVKLRTRLMPGTAVGTLIDGVVASDVKQKHTVMIPAGAPAGGRVRRLEHYDNSYFIVGLEFTQIEVQGMRRLFYADLQSLDLAPGIEMTLQPSTGSVKTPSEYQGVGLKTAIVTRENIFTHALAGSRHFFLHRPEDGPPGRPFARCGKLGR